MTDEDTPVVATIVRLHPERDLTAEDAPVTRVATTGRYCPHLHVRLDTTAHKVYCNGCDLEVDPFAFLLKLAGDWQRWSVYQKECQRRGKEARERLDEVLRLERNARARLKRVDPKAKQPEVPWGASNPSI